MCTKLSNNVQEERLRWVLPIIEKKTKLKDLAKVFYGGKRTLERWVSDYKKYGKEGLIPESTRPKSHPNETPIREKESIIEMRNKTKLCAQKLNYKLKKEGLIIGVRTIGKIIKQEGLVRKYRIKKLKYKYVKVLPTPGELVEIDIKYVPDLVNNKRYYQYTAIDCVSRWIYLKIYDNMGNGDTINFFKTILDITPFKIRAIKTDNGACFTNRYVGYLKSVDPVNPRLHPLDLECQRLNIIHYLIDPGKPAQNGKVERSHRTDQEMFYDRHKFKTRLELERAIRKWNSYYNDLEHCALNGMTPNEFLVNYS